MSCKFKTDALKENKIEQAEAIFPEIEGILQQHDFCFNGISKDFIKKDGI